MCSAMSKSKPSNCQPNSQEVRYKWAVLDTGRNSVKPWTTARTITCNKGIRFRFRNTRVPCQVEQYRSCRFGFDLGAGLEEDGHQQENGEGSARGTQPEGGPIVGQGAAGLRGKEIERAAGEHGSDEHADAISEEGEEALRGAAQVGGSLLVCVELSGH